MTLTRSYSKRCSERVVILDDPAIWIGIFIGVIATGYGVLQKLVWGPTGTVARKNLEEAREIEVRIKMGKGADVIDDYYDLGIAYSLAYKKTESERAMRQALQMAEREYGQKGVILIPILREYARVLRSMNRNDEAKNLEKRARDIEDSDDEA